MNVVYYGNFLRSWDTESYIARAFERLGHCVSRVEIKQASAGRHELRSSVQDNNPDLLLMAWPDLKVIEVVRSLRPHFGLFVSWSFDLLADDFVPSRLDWARELSCETDFFFTTDGSAPPTASSWRTLRQGSTDDVIDGILSEEYACDIAFVGSIYRDRRSWWRELKRRYAGLVVRSFDKVRGSSLSHLCASAKVVIAPSYPGRDQYWSNRIYVVAGYGGLLVHPVYTGLESEGWRSGEHYLGYEPYNSEGMFAALDLALGMSEEQRSGIAKSGQKLAAGLSYDYRVSQMLTEIRLSR